MKARSTLLTLPVAAALAFGALGPAHADAPDPVTDLTASAVQAPGTSPDHANFTVTATWTADPSAPPYSVQVLDGSCNDAHAYSLAHDVRTTSYTATLSNLADDTTYCLSVTAAGATAATTTFTTPVADTTAPHGHYSITPPSKFLTYDFDSDLDGMTATFRIAQVSADPDVVTRKVVAGDGSAAKVWKSGTTFPLTYAKAGTFTPHVLIADEFGNTTNIALSAVRVRKDTTAPRVRIVHPAHPGRIASWRTIRGSATDSQSGVVMTMVFTMERRHGVWWVYDFKKARWHEGVKSFNKTMNKSTAQPKYFLGKAAEHWRTPKIKGLTKGTLRVYAFAADQVGNFGRAPKVSRKIH